MATLRTGQLAQEAGVNAETLRFYERKGLLPIPPRRGAGFRQYPLEAVDRVRFIKRAQELGFSLKEIKGLLELGARPNATCAQVKERAEAKIGEIDRKLRDLKAVKKALEQLAETCPGDRPTNACPILNLVRLQSSGSR